MTTGMRESATFICRRRSRPLIPVIRRSSTRQPVFSRWADLRNSSAEANVSTPKPTDRRRFLRDRRSDSSSSTTATIGLSRSSMRLRCPSVNVGIESIYCEAKSSGGKRLPYRGGGGALPVGGIPCGSLRPRDRARSRFGWRRADPARGTASSETGERRLSFAGREASTLPWWGWPTPGRGNSEARGAPDQIGQRPGLHLLHHVPTLFLDGGFAGSQLPGDLLVEQTGDGGGHHVPLARSQRVIPATKLGELQPLRARHAIARDRVANGIEQVLLPKRLREKLDCTGLHGSNRHGNVAVPGEEDDRQRRVGVGKRLLQVEAAQSREADVEQEASRSMPSGAAQERLSAREDFHGQPHGREQSSEGIAKGPVIVDDEDDGALGAHRISGSAKRNVAPWFTFAVAHSRPLCASMIERLIDRPIPSPPGFVE